MPDQPDSDCRVQKVTVLYTACAGVSLIKDRTTEQTYPNGTWTVQITSPRQQHRHVSFTGRKETDLSVVKHHIILSPLWLCCSCGFAQSAALDSNERMASGSDLCRHFVMPLLLLSLPFTAAGDSEVRVSLGSDGISMADDGQDPGAWASDMLAVRLGEDGVEDEILPTIHVGSTEAELLDAPDPNGIAQLRRKQLGGARVDVLENQLLIVSGLESKEQRKSRMALGLGVENVLASELACRNINGTALFMLVHRQAVQGDPTVHELAFFDRDLWKTFVDYMRQAREKAPFFGGSSPVWALKIHWNVLPKEQRLPFVLKRSNLEAVAQPMIAV